MFGINMLDKSFLPLIHTLVDHGWNGKWDIMQEEIHLDTRPIKEPIDYHEALRIMLCIGTQLAVMQSNNESVFLFFDEDIEQLDEGWYTIVKKERWVPIVANDTVELQSPILLPPDLPPELVNLREKKMIPFRTNVSVAYFSLAQYVLRKMNLTKLEAIDSTPLYFMLKRCLRENPEERSFLFV